MQKLYRKRSVEIQKGITFVDPNWSFTSEQFKVLQFAIERVRMQAEQVAMSEERAIELIVADYLAGVE